MPLSKLIHRFKPRRPAVDDRPEAYSRSEAEARPIEVESEDWKHGMVREFRELYDRDHPS